MESQQAELIEKYQASQLNNLKGDRPESDEEDDLLETLEALEDDDQMISKYREQRLDQLKKEFGKIDRAASTHGDNLGTIFFTDDEKELMDTVTSSEVAIVHFYQPTFGKCRLMNERLSLVAEKHLLVRVLAIPAEKTPFLVSKLKIQVLPFVVVYRNGKEVTRIVGFEGLGPNPGEVTDEGLEQRLYQCGAINRKTTNFASVRSRTHKPEDDSEDDWY